MQLPDVDVLIYAHREDVPEHHRYAAWLRALAEADEPFALAEIVLASFLRIVTNHKIFEPPTPMETAIAFCRRLVEWPRAVLLMPTRRHWNDGRLEDETVKMAERVGFEPTVEFPLHTLSKRAPSTTRTSLRF